MGLKLVKKLYLWASGMVEKNLVARGAHESTLGKPGFLGTQFENLYARQGTGGTSRFENSTLDTLCLHNSKVSLGWHHG